MKRRSWSVSCSCILRKYYFLKGNLCEPHPARARAALWPLLEYAIPVPQDRSVTNLTEQITEIYTLPAKSLTVSTPHFITTNELGRFKRQMGEGHRVLVSPIKHTRT